MLRALVKPTVTQKNGHLPALFDDGFFTDLFRPSFVGEARPLWPAIDIREFKDRFVLQADIPGVDEKDLKIEVSDGHLIIEGKRMEESSAEDSSLLVQERPQASFRRAFALGDGLDSEKIDADYRNGTLTVTIPKTERALPRVIPIAVKRK